MRISDWSSDVCSSDLVDRPYPWGALWCLLPAGSWPHVDELRQRYVAARKMIGLLPVGSRPGDHTQRLSFFWSLRTDAFAQSEANGLAAWMDDLHQLWPEARDVSDVIAEPTQTPRAHSRDTHCPPAHKNAQEH